MATEPKGAPAPEAEDSKKKSKWTIDSDVGRFTVKFPTGNTTSALMGWWGKLPEELRPVCAYGVKQLASDNAALGKEASVADKEAAIADKLQAIAEGDFTAGPALVDILTAFVKLGAAKDVADAGKRWKAKTPAEREGLLALDKVKLAIKAAFSARRAASAEAAFASGKGDPIKL